MGSEWRKEFLTDLYEIRSGLSKPAKDFGTGYPFLAFKDVFNNFFVPETLSQLVQSSAKERENCSVRRGDVFLTRTSETMHELGMSCVSLRDYENATFNGFTKRLRPKKEVGVVPEYVGYFLRGPGFRNEMTTFSTMSTRASLNNEMIGRLKIALPTLPEQKAIANILGSLDDRIELNRRMNETLESMAQALFKSWFVDFDPVIDNALASGKEIPIEFSEKAQVRATHGNKRKRLPEGIRSLFSDEFTYSKELGWIPKGWEDSIIGNELKTILGGTPARKNKDFWSDGRIPWINSGKVNEFRVIEPSEYITEEAVRKSSTKLLPKRTTLLAITGATLGQVSINEIECCANQSVVGIIGNKKVPNEYIYLWIQNTIEKIISSQTGGAQQHINKGNVNEANILLPNEIILEYFSEIAKANFDNIALNCFSIQNLTKLRDTLLPKLLSGEIRIPDAEKMVEELAL